MSTLNVTSIKGRAGATPSLPDGAVISGINTIDASGIKVGNGIVLASGGALTATTGTFNGNVSATAFAGSGANLTNLPAQSPVLTGIASGTVPANRALCIHSDGKVGVVTGTKAVWNSRENPVSGQVISGSQSYGLAYGNGVVLAHVNNASGQARVIAGTYSGSGSTITWGTPVEVESSGCEQNEVIYDSGADKFLIVYRHSNTGKSRVVSVTGNTPTLASVVNFKGSNGAIESIDIAYDPDTNQIGIAYKEGNTNNCHVRLGAISGTTVSYGAETTYSGNNSNGPVAICYDTKRNKFILAAGYADDNSDSGWAWIGTVSGTGISVVSAGLIKYNYTQKIKMIYDPNRDRYIFVGWNTNDTQWESLTGTYNASGPDITWRDNGMIVDGNTGGSGIGLVYNPFGQNYVLMIATAGPDQIQYFVGELGGEGTPDADQITWGHKKILNGSNQGGTITATRADKSIILGYGYGSPVIMQVQIQELQDSTLLVGGDNFIGYSANAYTNGQTVTINIVGNTAEAYSGLSVGRKYYIQGDGGVGTKEEVSSYPATFTVAGVSLSSSKLIIK